MRNVFRGKIRLIALAAAVPLLIGLYSLWGQDELQITDIRADSSTKSSVRIGFKTTKPGNYVIIYGVDARYGYQSSQVTANKGGVGIITGLSPDQDVHYRVCYVPGGGTTQILCAADQVAHTTATEVRGVELAVEPKTFETPMPPLNGETFVVDSSCSNFREQLAKAAKADGSLNHYVLIPAGTSCYGNLEFAPKNGPNPGGDGVIVVRSAAPDTDLPPEGMRVNPAWEKSMARIVNNAIFSGYGGELPGECTPEEFTWLTSYNSVNKYHVCVDKNTWKPMESLSNYSAGPELPGACAEGDLFLVQKPNSDVRYQMSRCISENTWVPVTPRGDGGYALGTPYQQAVRGYRLMGLIFETAEPNGVNYGSLLNIGNYSSKHSNVVVDRCIFRVPPKGSVFSGLLLNGSQVAVVNSWFDLRVVPTMHPYNPVANSAAINITGGTGPFRIYNNYVRGSGFMVFVNDNDNVVPRDDIEIRRNTFTYNDDFRCGSPTSDKICRDVRGPIEFKRGRRILMEGNIIDNFWSTLSGGQAIIVTPRASGSTGPDDNAYQITDLTIRYNIVRNGTGFVLVAGQDDVGYRNTRITQRVTIEHNLITGIDAYTRSDTGYGSNRGQIVAVSNGVEDLTFRHNTVVDNRGSGPSFLHASYAAMSGLDFRDNILWVNKSEVGNTLGIRWSEPATLPTGAPAGRANAKGILDGFALRIPNTGYDFRNNVIVAGPGVRMSDLRSSYPNASVNRFLQQDNPAEDPVGFEKFPDNFRVNSTSSMKSFASDRTDPGADIDELERRTGQIRAHWPDAVTADGVTIVFYPPDEFPCMAEFAESNTFENAIRARDVSTGDRHLLPVTGLQPGTHYYYRLSCATATVTNEFDTIGAAQ